MRLTRFPTSHNPVKRSFKYVLLNFWVSFARPFRFNGAQEKSNSHFELRLDLSFFALGEKGFHVRWIYVFVRVEDITAELLPFSSALVSRVIINADGEL